MKLMVSTTCSSLFISAIVPAHALVGMDSSSAPPDGMSLYNERRNRACVDINDIALCRNMTNQRFVGGHLRIAAVPIW